MLISSFFRKTHFIYMSKICVIVPVYKVELYIYRCIDSILAQTFRDFELILVDDGTPDKSGAICDEYATHDNRIHVIHQENGGLSVARNTGIEWSFKYSDSEWLNFIDSDDYVHPKYLEILYATAVKMCVPLAACKYAMTRGEALIVDETCLEIKRISSNRYYCESAVPATVTWGKLYKKQLFENIRFPIGRYHEDEFTTYKLLYKCKKIAVISQHLYAYYQNPDGITHSISWEKLCVDKIEALVEQITFFQKRHYITAEMQRLIICINKFKQVDSNSALFLKKDILYISEQKNQLLDQYPSVLTFICFIKKYKHYKTIFPLVYFIYDKYKKLYCLLHKIH